MSAEDAAEVTLAGARLMALPSGALHWPARGLLAAADLHLGRAARDARGGGALLPPYEARETLTRLAGDLQRTGARTLVLLGDSFDSEAAAAELDAAAHEALMTLAAGRRVIWIAGNHDPGPVGLPGTHMADWRAGSLSFRHIADPAAPAGEMSGHYHPKLRLSRAGRPLSRRCFLTDGRRMILPAYGAYAGGLHAGEAPLTALIARPATAILTGTRARPVRLGRSR